MKELSEWKNEKYTNQLIQAASSTSNIQIFSVQKLTK